MSTKDALRVTMNHGGVACIDCEQMLKVAAQEEGHWVELKVHVESAPSCHNNGSGNDNGGRRSSGRHEPPRENRILHLEVKRDPAPRRITSTADLAVLTHETPRRRTIGDKDDVSRDGRAKKRPALLRLSGFRRAKGVIYAALELLLLVLLVSHLYHTCDGVTGSTRVALGGGGAAGREEERGGGRAFVDVSATEVTNGAIAQTCSNVRNKAACEAELSLRASRDGEAETGEDDGNGDGDEDGEGQGEEIEGGEADGADGALPAEAVGAGGAAARLSQAVESAFGRPLPSVAGRIAAFIDAVMAGHADEALATLGCRVAPDDVPNTMDLLALLVVVAVVLLRVGHGLRRLLRRIGLWTVLWGAPSASMVRQSVCLCDHR